MAYMASEDDSKDLSKKQFYPLNSRTGESSTYLPTTRSPKEDGGKNGLESMNNKTKTL